MDEWAAVPPCHPDGSETIEFVAKLLAIFPGKQVAAIVIGLRTAMFIGGILPHIFAACGGKVALAIGPAPVLNDNARAS